MSKQITVTDNGDHYEFDWGEYRHDTPGAIIALSYALGNLVKKDVKEGHLDDLVDEIANLITTVSIIDSK